MPHGRIDESRMASIGKSQGLFIVQVGLEGQACIREGLATNLSNKSQPLAHLPTESRANTPHCFQFDNRSILTPAMTLEGHEPILLNIPNVEQYYNHSVASISYFPDGEQMIIGSTNKTARRWDLRAGTEIEETRDVCDGPTRGCQAGVVRILQGHSQSITSTSIRSINADVTVGAPFQGHIHAISVLALSLFSLALLPRII